MKNTLLPGDIVLVSKFHYGSRFITDGKIKRGPSISSINYEDILVFNFPEGDTIFTERPDINFYQFIGRRGRREAMADTLHLGKPLNIPLKFRKPYIKRCIALPGDELIIHNKSLYLKGMSGYDRVEAIRNEKNRNIYPEKDPEKYRWAFPHVYNWNPANMGPLKIPKKGLEIDITLTNLPLYRRIIETYENNRLTIKDNLIYINKKPVDSYQFKKNYFFVRGDNKKNSMDSRFWGFLPEDHVIGKAMLVLLSIDKDENNLLNKIRWDRIFKGIKKEN